MLNLVTKWQKHIATVTAILNVVETIRFKVTDVQSSMHEIFYKRSSTRHRDWHAIYFLIQICENPIRFARWHLLVIISFVISINAPITVVNNLKNTSWIYKFRIFSTGAIKNSDYARFNLQIKPLYQAQTSCANDFTLFLVTMKFSVSELKYCRPLSVEFKLYLIFQYYLYFWEPI